MESFLNRYRNITVLLLVIFAQLVLIAVQVKSDSDIPMIRVWTVTAVTPVARLIEAVRGGGAGLVHNYVLLRSTDAENRRLQAERDKLKLDNLFLRNQLNTAERAKALQLFQQSTPSRTVAATVIGTSADSGSKVVFVDRGTGSGVMRGMAVVTPDGIVGKVIAAYPTASEVMLVTDAQFAAGAISQARQVRGTLKGQGTPMCKVDYVPFEEKVEPGDWFYTSGDDRVFPRGFPIGIVKAVRSAQPYKEVFVEPSGLQRGLEDVLILVQAVHQDIPDQPPSTQPVYLAPPLPGSQPAVDPGQTAVPPGQPAPAAPGTEADKLRNLYKAAGDAQKHEFGTGLPGSKPPDFTKLGQEQPPPALPAGSAIPAQGAAPNAPVTPAVKTAPQGAQQPAAGTQPKAPGAASPPQTAPKRAPSATPAAGQPGGPAVQ